ncbi:UNVERIFIED_ORG: DNA polymerase elongation subunit (family B) [Comamonas terrigena]
MARSDWTLLRRQFQDSLLSRVLKGEPYKEFVTEYVHVALAGHKDDQLVYRKRQRHHLDEYVKNVPLQVRAARIVDEYNQRMQRPKQYQKGSWIQYVTTINGPQPLEILSAPHDYGHYVTKQLQPIADAILGPLAESFAELSSPQNPLF